jgi:hypothetical protein
VEPAYRLSEILGYKNHDSPECGILYFDIDVTDVTMEQSELTNKGHKSDDTVAQVRCDCGNWLKTTIRDNWVTCECGRRFAVTISEITDYSQYGD